mgnify:CR=1 FL=1
MTWQIPFGFSPRHYQMLLDIEAALWESSVIADDEVAEAYKEIQQAHQHIKDAIAILKEDSQ